MTVPSDKDELLRAIEEEFYNLEKFYTQLPADKINTASEKNSWSASQLLNHVTKSTAGIAKAMQASPNPVNRIPGARIDELKKIFLDFSTKMQSPEMIVPDDGPYEKQNTLNELNNSFRRLKENAASADLTDKVEGLPFGDVTKLELLHFILYHTQRHVHQMQVICDMVLMAA